MSSIDYTKLDFDSIYKDRNSIREFGLIGKSRKISIFLNDGLFRLNDQDIIHLYIKTDDDRFLNISNNIDCKYNDIITIQEVDENGDNIGEPIKPVETEEPVIMPSTVRV